MIVFIAGIIVGAILDNAFAPKIEVTKTGITLKFKDKTSKP